MDPGTRLGPYEIKEPLGEGGMGQVYRAHDGTLRRDVAVKLLPEDVADDPQRLARLKREARSLAALNHPHIAAVHGFEEQEGTSFIVMELVQGQTLAEKLEGGPLPVQEALELGVQIARAVEAAHERGIVHRDLKPQNVKITPSGEAKVLDFGLAKPLERDPEGSDTELPTATVKTRTGAVMGTPPYMSPEQIRGEPVDQRSDIWAFGCLAYEMLTGRGPFTTQTASDTMSAILSQDPDWEALPAGTPVLARSLLRRCLSKDPQRRLHHVADARIELQEALRDEADGLQISPEAITPQPHALRRVMRAGSGAVIVLLLVVVGWLLIRAERPPPETRRFQLQPPPGVEIVTRGGPATLAVSDDGQWVAFTGSSDGRRPLYLRSIEELEARQVPGTEGGASTPFFSPDGRWLGFWADGRLQKIPVDGQGAAVRICPARQLRGASWGEDGTILFSAGGSEGGLFRVSASGGEPTAVTTPEPERGEFAHYWPQYLPGVRAAVFMIHSRRLRSDDHEIAVLSLQSGEYRTLGIAGTYPRYVSTGHLIYLRRGTLHAVPFDIDDHEVTGESRPVLDDVDYYIGSFSAAYAVSESGSLVYVPGAPQALEGELVWLDREGNVGSLIDGTRAFDYDFARFSLSPDQDRLAIAIRHELEEAAIWTYEFERDNWSHVTPATLSGGVLWSPDGEWLVFNPAEPGYPTIARIRADGTGEPELLTNEWDYAGSFSPDGHELAFMRQPSPGNWDLWILPLDDDQPARPFLTTSALEAWPVFSPDGRWLAYQSTASGQHEVYVRPYPGPGARIKVSTRGGRGPARWSPDGTELFYRSDKGIWAVPVEIGDEFEAGRPRRLFEAEFLINPGNNQFRVSLDGQRFYVVRYEEETRRAPRLAYVQNWSRELENRVPSPE